MIFLGHGRFMLLPARCDGVNLLVIRPVERSEARPPGTPSDIPEGTVFYEGPDDLWIGFKKGTIYLTPWNGKRDATAN